jgi:hypothetical protein
MLRTSGPQVALVLLALAGCGGVPADRGLSAEMMVSGAQFSPGAMPAAGGGPEVVNLDIASNAIRAGEIEAPLSGSLGPTATAAAVGLLGDKGYWIVPAGLPDVSAPAYPTFAVSLSFSAGLAAGTYELAVQAVDAESRFGPPQTAVLTASVPPVAMGAMVVSLRWDTEADLDLHVVDPLGNIIWREDIRPAGSGAYLDFDSNAGCVIDGRRLENVIWKDTPPSGRYQLLVDTFALCGETFANWTVEARLGGQLVGSAAGESLETDTEVPHDGGAGVLALEIVVP